MRTEYSVLALLVFVCCLGGCAFFEPDPVTESFQSMGTRASVTLAGRDAARMPEARARAKEVLDRLEAEMSVYRLDSAISRLNRLAGTEPMEMPGDSLRLLELSREYGRLTGGAFDVTVGPVVSLWRFGKDRPPAIPSERELTRQRGLVGYAKVRLEGKTAFLPQPGMRVDLGGIAKGYAVDLAWEQVRKLGLAGFLIDLGGNVRVSGRPRRGKGWSIEIRNPFDTSSTLGRLDLQPGWAVATSGQYERFVVIDGRRYGHIIDPRTGYPAVGLAAVTVIADDATVADALSTGLFVLGPRAALPILKETKAEAIFIPEKEPAELWVTPGIEKRLVLTGRGTVGPLPGW